MEAAMASIPPEATTEEPVAEAQLDPDPTTPSATGEPQPTDVSATEAPEPEGPSPLTVARDHEVAGSSFAPSSAPVAPNGGISIRGGYMAMRVLSRAMQDFEADTGGAIAATYEQVDHYVGNAIRSNKSSNAPPYRR